MGSSPDTRTTVDVLGCAIDRVDMEQAVLRCERTIETRGYLQHMALNAAKLVAMQDDGYLREVVGRCGLVTADGQSIVWASRLLGDPLPCRVTGIDLMVRLLELAEAKGYSVYVLGARDHVLEQAIERIARRHPRLRLAGYRNGYFEDSETEEIVSRIRALDVDLVFVGMSSPRKEYFLGAHGPSLGAPFVMGVGGAIDVLAGATQRAPRAFQRLGLEWLYRLAQEPRRMFKRYAVSNARFVAMLFRALARRRA